MKSIKRKYKKFPTGWMKEVKNHSECQIVQFQIVDLI